MNRTARTSAILIVSLLAFSTALAREAEPGDDHGRGGHGKGHALVLPQPNLLMVREAEPGDDRGRGGHGKGHALRLTSPLKFVVREAEPGDDRGGRGGRHG